MTSLIELKTLITQKIRGYNSSKAIVATFWVVAGSGGSQAIRLASNLILTRLLFPEIFGIMALVHAVIIGLGQLSDVGLREGVVNSSRIKDPDFMNSAWTLQILRSTAIAIAAAILAIPLANYYGKDVLAPVLAMTGLGLFIVGFKSIGLLAYDKRLDLKTQVLVDIGVQAAGIVVVLIWAWVSPSIWALVAGHIFSCVLEVTLSYMLFTGRFTKIRWEKSAISELFNFGKWIIVSSTISYIIVQGDRLIMGAWLTMTELGLYSIASNWAAIVSLISVNLSSRVLHPFFRDSLDKQTDFNAIHKTRMRLNIIYLIICSFIAILGEHIIIFLYDDRYREAGWILQVLAAGQFGRVLTGTLRPFLTAKGDSFSQMVTSAASAAILIIFIIIGGYLGQAPGVIIAYAITGIVIHPIMIIFAHKHGYKCMASDMGMVLIAVAVCGLIWFALDAPVIDVVSNMKHSVN